MDQIRNLILSDKNHCWLLTYFDFDFKYLANEDLLDNLFDNKNITNNIICHMVEFGHNLEAMDKRKYSILHHACYHGVIDVVRILIKKNIDLNVGTNIGNRPIHVACYFGYFEIVKLLCSYKSVIQDYEEDVKPIHFASKLKNSNILKHLIKIGANIEVEDNQKYRPIHYACKYDSVENVKVLIENGANLEVRTLSEERPIHMASKSITEIIKLLIGKKVNLEVSNVNEWRPIHYACNYSCPENVKILIDQGVDLEAEIFSTKWRPIHMACFYANFRIIKLLVDGFYHDDVFPFTKNSPKISLNCLNYIKQKPIDLISSKNKTIIEYLKFKMQIQNSTLYGVVPDKYFDINLRIDSF